MALPLLGLGACDQAENVEYVARTRFFEITVHENANVPCVGDIEVLDEFFFVLHDLFALGLPDERLPVHSWEDSDPGFPCPDSAGGCFRLPFREVHVRQLGSTLEHEIVHAALTERLDPLYSEGLAHTFTTIISRSTSLGFDPRASLAATSPGEVNYNKAAVFADFMLERFGPEVTLEAFEAASSDDPPAAFLAATGQSLDEIAESFMASEYQCSSQLVRCSQPAIEVGESWSMETTMACAEPSTLGQFASNTVLHIEQAGTYTLELDSAYITLERCAPCAERESWTIIAPSSQIELEAGDYWLYFTPLSPSPVKLAIHHAQ